MIELKGLQKVIDGTAVVDIPSLQVKGGEIVTIFGPVDSGIESLMELLTGQARPTAGEIRLVGVDPYLQKEAFSRGVGVLFSEDNLYGRMSAEGNLKFYARLRRLPKKQVEEVLTRVGLVDHAKVRVDQLPSSLKRRLAFGRAILHQPRVLILEESLSKCDEASVALLGGLIRQLASEEAAVLNLVEDPTNYEDYSDRVYRMERGKLRRAHEPADETGSTFPFMIPSKQEGKVDLVDPADILCVVAQHDRAYLQTAEALLPTHFTLAELEKRLSRSGFFRAHRSYLVNLQHVKEVIPFTRNSFSLRLKDAEGTLIPLSRAAAAELRELLGY